MLLRGDVRHAQRAADAVDLVARRPNVRADREAELEIAVYVDRVQDPAGVAMELRRQLAEVVDRRLRNAAVRTHELPRRCEESGPRSVQEQVQHRLTVGAPRVRDCISANVHQLVVAAFEDTRAEIRDERRIDRRTPQLGHELFETLAVDLRSVSRQGNGVRLAGGLASEVEVAELEQAVHRRPPELPQEAPRHVLRLEVRVRDDVRLTVDRLQLDAADEPFDRARLELATHGIAPFANPVEWKLAPANRHDAVRAGTRAPRQVAAVERRELNGRQADAAVEVVGVR